jgi:fluoride ion exporter CrcB/FEX
MIVVPFLALAVLGAGIRWRATAAGGTRATLAVNTVGALLLGLLVGSNASNGLITVLGTAGIGSLTTVSGWVNEVSTRWHTARRHEAARLVITTLVLCVGAAWFGLQIAS